MSTPIADPDFAQEIVEDLYRYRYKQHSTARLLLIFTGILGGHRLYLGKPITALLFFLTGGGALFLWLWDFTQIKRLVDEYNQTEDERRAARLPPQSLSFLPPLDELELDAPPTWAKRRDGKAVLFGGYLLLAIIGLAMGALAGSSGVVEPPIIMLVFMAITLVAARWPSMRKFPVLGDLSRWNHRLRLYYFTTDPGSIWLLATRPYIGIFAAPWRKKSRAEVRLYLQIGVAFGIVFIAFDIYEVRESGFWAGLGLTLAELVQTVIYTYIFVAPVGAILLTQQLLARKDGVVAMMCFINLLCGYLGLMAVGAL